jgi:hypothetical protein
MNEATLTGSQVDKIIDGIPKNLDEDHLIALMKTILTTQRPNQRDSQNLALLFRIFMGECLAVGVLPEKFDWMLQEAMRIYPMCVVKH